MSSISCEKLSVYQFSMMGLAELQSNATMSISSCDSMIEEQPSMMSVAELQCKGSTNKKNEQKCGGGDGQSEVTGKQCTVCTVVQNEKYENGPSAANLAISRMNRCISTSTKGGPSSKRGGGQASRINQHFEEKLQGETDKLIIAHSSDSSDSQNISFISSKKISFQDSKFRKLPRKNITNNIVNIYYLIKISTR